MADEVQKTDTKGEEKSTGLNLKDLFNPPEVDEAATTTGVKDSDTAEDSSPEDVEVTDPKELQAKVSALTKELGRVRKGKSESTSEVRELREQLANFQGQLEILSKPKATEEVAENRLAKYTDEQLLQGQTEWEEAVYDSKDASRRARTDNDDAAFEKATKGIGTAKATLTAIRKEILERTKRVGAEQARSQGESNELIQDVAALYEETMTALPDLKDKESALWKASNEAYMKHAKLMKTLGPMAELVATSIAISQNPKLLPGGNQEKVARKSLLEEINAQAEKSLTTGKGTPNKRVATDWGAMPKGDFEAVINKLKRGES